MTEENSQENKTGTDQQPVAPEANAPQQNEAAAAPVESAQPEEVSLDSILQEYDQRRASHQPQVPPQQYAPPQPQGEQPYQQELPAQPDPVIVALERRFQEQEARQFTRELNELYKEFADGTNADAVDAEGYLTAMAKREPKLNQIYLDRERDPRSWEKAKAELKKDFNRRWGKKVDRQVTESKDAFAAAVRSASTAAAPKEYSAKEIHSLPKDEFDEMQRKLGVTPV